MKEINDRENDKIFVSIACLMDPDIVNTIEDCLDKAYNPDRIVFGICLQHDPDEDYLVKYNNNEQLEYIECIGIKRRGLLMQDTIVLK